jgi:hypothetical protein
MGGKGEMKEGKEAERQKGGEVGVYLRSCAYVCMVVCMYLLDFVHLEREGEGRRETETERRKGKDKERQKEGATNTE